MNTYKKLITTGAAGGYYYTIIKSRHKTSCLLFFRNGIPVPYFNRFSKVEVFKVVW